MSLSSEIDEIDLGVRLSPPRAVVYNSPEEEIAYGPACYLASFSHQVKEIPWLTLDTFSSIISVDRKYIEDLRIPH